MKYLNNNDYKINYLKRLDEIKNFLKEVSFETLSWNERNKNPENPQLNQNKIGNFKRKFHRYFRIKKHKRNC